MSALLAIEQEIRQHPIVSHPFLKTLSRGSFSKEQIALWISQQFYFSNQFPRCLAALYARMEDFETSKALMPFLFVEHWGSEDSSAHWKKFKQTLSFFGYSIDELKRQKPFPETSEYLSFRLNICLQRPIQEGLGAMGFGHELVNEQIFASYLAGIEKLPHVSKNQLAYFQSHVDDEPEDYLIFKRMMEVHIKGEKDVEKIKKGAEEVLAARIRFFDRMLERITQSDCSALPSI